MTDIRGIRDNAAQAAPFWAQPGGYALIVLLLSLPRLIAGLWLPLLSDEAYYAFWSMYPGPGYFDHAPGIAWVVGLGRWLFGEGIFPIRSVTVALGLVSLALLYRIGRVLFADARIAALGGFFFAVTPAALESLTEATPDGISVLFWIAAIWAAAEFGRSRNKSWWLAVGVFTGLGLLSKYTNAFLLPGLFVYLLVTTERRRWLASWQVWAGVVLALLLFVPVLWWNAQHDWISFRFQFGRTTLTGRHGSLNLEAFGIYWVALALMLLPPAFLLSFAGLPRWLRRGDDAAGLDLLVWTTLPMVLFFAVHSLISVANPNWLDPVFPILALLGGYSAVMVRNWATAILRWTQIPLGLLLIIVFGAGALLGALPGGGLRPLLSYGRGWDGVAADLAVLAKAQQAQWVDTDNYLAGSLIAYAMVTNRDPLPVLQTNEPFRYSFRPPPSDAMLKAPHLLMTGAPAPVVAGATVVPVGSVVRRDGVHQLDTYPVYLVTMP